MNAEFDHMDLPCIKMLNNILTGANRIKFNMATAVAEAIGDLNAYRKDHNLPVNLATPTYVRNSHHHYDRRRKPGDTSRMGWRVASIENEWCFFTTDSGSSPLSLAEHLKLLNIGVDRIPEMVRISVDVPRIETPKGFVLLPTSFTGWVYDPKGYFWPKE